MNKFDIIKTGVSAIASFGVGAVVGNVIKSTTPAGERLISKISIGVGGLILTGIAGDMASKYVEDKMDSFRTTAIDILKINKSGVSGDDDDNDQI